MFALIQVWSEKSQTFIWFDSSIETLKHHIPNVVDWRPNGVGGVTSKSTGLVIRKLD